MSPERADMIILSGQIHTQDPEQPLVEAIAIKNGKIVKLGSNQEVRKMQSRHTRTLELAGQSVLPGLIDSHIHTIEGALALDACSMDDQKLTMTELSARIRQCAKQQSGSDWLQVVNVRSVGLTINKEDLDQILPKRPLFLVSTDGHTGWANSVALKTAGISPSTKAPDNGEIVYDVNAQLTGVLRDGATTLVSQVIPAMPLQQRVDALNRVMNQLYEAGISAFLEANSNAASVETFCALAQQGKLKARVTLALYSEGEATEYEFSRLEQLRQKAAECGLLADTIKLYADGVMEYPTQTAAMLQPYLNDDGQQGQNRGSIYQSLTALTAFSSEALQRGFSIHVHSIGDAATHTTLDAFEVARKHAENTQRRLSISHLQLIDPADYSRFAQLNVIASLQLLWAQPDEYSVDAILPYIGSQRHSRLYPAASLLDAGATIAGGSDWNVSSFNPFMAMAIGRSRKNPDHPEFEPLNVTEALSLSTLLDAYTHNAAKILGREQQIGQLKVGMAADLIVLDRPLNENMTAAELSATKVHLNLIGGEPVFGQLN
jgi:predicted amidohydrolase YtcJ